MIRKYWTQGKCLVSWSLIASGVNSAFGYDLESTIEQFEKSAFSSVSTCEESLSADSVLSERRRELKSKSRYGIEQVLEAAGLTPEKRRLYQARRVVGDYYDEVPLKTPDLFLKRLRSILTEREYLDVSGQIKAWNRNELSAFNERLEALFFDLFSDLSSRRSELSLIEMRKELLDLCRLYSNIFDRSSSVYERAIWISQWASKQEDRARFAYETMLSFTRDREPKLVLGFMQANPFFKDAVRLRHDPTLIVTTAFEKETPNAAVVSFYRNMRYSDEAWLAMSVDARKVILDKMSDHFVSTVYDTEKLRSTPDYFANKLKTEGMVSGRVIFEFTQDGYAISPTATIRRIEEVAKITNETHSFHGHIVGEVPSSDPQEFLKFDAWFKDANWQLMFQGFEEGLFPNKYTQIKKTSYWETFGDAAENKFLTLGYRTGIYGNARTPGYIKVGLELRDPTRKIARWDGLIQRIAEVIAQRKWNVLADNLSTGIKSLKIDEIESILWSAGIEQEYMIKMLVSEESNSRSIGVPLSNFRELMITNWKNGKSRPIPGAVMDRLDRARKIYLDGLVHLSREIAILDRRGESYSSEDIRSAILHWVTEWAQQARPAEIFSAL